MGKERLINYDMLRIMAMFFVVIFHFYVHGVMHLHTSPENGFAVTSLSSTVEIINYVLSELCIVIVSTGVNLFVMISGFFLIERKEYRVSSLILLWVRLFIYSVVIALVFLFLDKIEPQTAVLSLFPLSTSRYWFMTRYFGLMLIAPFISQLACSLNQKQYKVLLCALFIINFIFPIGRFLSGGVVYYGLSFSI